MIFSQDEREPFRARIAALPMPPRQWTRPFPGNASARMLVSPAPRAASGISRQAARPGTVNHFEFWDAGTRAARQAEAIKGEPPEAFKDFAF